MKKIFFPLLLSALALSSCKKEFDAPPARTIGEGTILTVADVKNVIDTAVSYKFTSDYSVYAYVTMDEVSGNIYKNVYVQDSTGAINVRLLASGGLYQGDYIRINLKNTRVGKYNGAYQIDSVDVDNNVVKQSVGNTIDPLVIPVTGYNSSMQGKLVRFDNVQFAIGELGQTYADAVNQSSVNHYLEDCSGNSILVRTSGYASFANQPIGTGSGSLVGIITEYNGDVQVYIRKLSEVTLTNNRCGGIYLNKNFEDLSITSGGWTQQLPFGGIAYTADSFGGDNFGKISNYNGSANIACESWYISPAVDLTAATAPQLSFRTACNYTGANIEVYISTNYDGVSAPNTATWTLLSPALSAGSWTWVNSGNLDLSSYLTTNVRVAFKYTGTGSAGKTWEIDDIKIMEL